VKLKRSLAYTPTRFGLPLSSSLKKIMAHPTSVVDHAGTAKCPAPLLQAGLSRRYQDFHPPRLAAMSAATNLSIRPARATD
jgi:hypothetical protein